MNFASDLRTSGDFNDIRENERPVPQNRGPTRRQEPPWQPPVPVERTPASKPENAIRQAKRNSIPSAQLKPQSIVNKPSKPSTADSGPGRPPKLSSEQKPNAQFSSVQRKLSNGPQDVRRKYHIWYLKGYRIISLWINLLITFVLQKSKNSDEASVDAKLEQAKRKLHERYQQVENGLLFFFFGCFFHSIQIKTNLTLLLNHVLVVQRSGNERYK